MKKGYTLTKDKLEYYLGEVMSLEEAKRKVWIDWYLSIGVYIAVLGVFIWLIYSLVLSLH